MEGELKADGIVLDYKEIKKIVEEKTINKLDHTNLNDLIKNSSSENVCIWIWEQLKNDLPLKKLTLYETENQFCEYQPRH